MKTHNSETVKYQNYIQGFHSRKTLCSSFSQGLPKQKEFKLSLVYMRGELINSLDRPPKFLGIGHSIHKCKATNK